MITVHENSDITRKLTAKEMKSAPAGATCAVYYPSIAKWMYAKLDRNGEAVNFGIYTPLQPKPSHTSLSAAMKYHSIGDAKI